MVRYNCLRTSRTYRSGWQIVRLFLRMYEIIFWKTKCCDDVKEWVDCSFDILARLFLCVKDSVRNRIIIKLGRLEFEVVRKDLLLYLMFQPEEQTSVDRPNPRDWNACQRKCTSPTKNNGWSFAPRKDTTFVAPNDQNISTYLLYENNHKILIFRPRLLVSKPTIL